MINYLYVKVFYHEWTNQEGEINEKFIAFSTLKDKLERQGVFKDNESWDMPLTPDPDPDPKKKIFRLPKRSDRVYGT